MPENNRIASIDIMRGLTLILMLFVNDLFMPGVPAWLGQSPAQFDGMGLGDWVLPGFLFIVGLAIPFSISKRLADGETNIAIGKHILIRTVSLLVIGVLMINSERVNSEFTGIGKNLWTILMYIGVFLVWNKYTRNDKNFFVIEGVKLIGIAILVLLVFKFKSGEFENNGSLIIGWWGILGVIGWGYLIAAFIYLAVSDNILNTVVALFFFLAFNILTNLELLNALSPYKSIFGVIIAGNVPFLVIGGLLTALILKKYSSTDQRKTIITIISIAILSITAGFILRKWFIISKIEATPSWGLICNGISMLIFSFIYWITDIQKKISWTFFFRSAGENSLTAYLAPNILYSLILTSGLPILIYKQSGIPVIVIAGSLAWAFLMVLLTKIMVKYNIKLRI